MSTPHIRLSTDALAFCRRLHRLERTGQYEKGLREISEEWKNPLYTPDTGFLPPVGSAGLLLRFAALLGFYGQNHQLTESQERSRNLLTEAREIFLELEDRNGTWECENYLALAYWRSGELNEAIVWVETAISQMPHETTGTLLHAHVVRSLILLSQKRYYENIAASVNLAPLFFRFGDAFLTGSFCTNIGLSFKNIGKGVDALRYLELAREYHVSSGHGVYLGTVENNLAQLYKAESRFARAHASIDNAVQTFRKAKDRTREGFALDTKASISLSEGEPRAALDSVTAAVKILRKSENAAYFAETLQTKFKVHLKLDEIAAAIAAFAEAAEIARTKIGDEAADRIFDEFRIAANERAESKKAPEKVDRVGIASGHLQLVLPQSIARFEDYQGIWINNEHLESVGLPKGSLAIIVNEKASRGDLVAISEIETEAVSCGFYDEDFGIVCLEGVNSEPQLFDTADIRVLGKIIGVCDRGEDEQGKMIVSPVSGR
ncbi:MAG: tetratricopeptide repeat protein [Pyrinomonadaceae bacterium]